MKQTYTYKTVGALKIEADVYHTPDGSLKPVVVWLHGGGLVVGSREEMLLNVLRFCQRQNYVFVALGYRLAPETKLPGILEDVRDGIRWIRTAGPSLFGADPDRIVVTGASAGGYLALMSGLIVQPRPVALVCYWGYGDLAGDWHALPSEYHQQQYPHLSHEQAYRAVGHGPIAGTLGATSELRRARVDFYYYLRQHGLWTQEVTGLDPARDRDRLLPYCPVRHITPDYPPTLLIHGEADADVPFSEAQAMDAALAAQRVEHELIAIPGAGHGLEGGHRPTINAAFERALQFIERHVQSSAEGVLKSPTG